MKRYVRSSEPQKTKLREFVELPNGLMKAFAEIVEDVKQLSAAEKEELHCLLLKYLIEERRQTMRKNAEASLEEYREGKLESFSNIDELMNSVSGGRPTNPSVI